MLVERLHDGPDTGREAVVVLGSSKNKDILRRNALVGDTPLPGDLASSIGSLSSGTHGGDLVEAEPSAERLGNQGPLGGMGGHVGEGDCKSNG